jgi:hypothetical protein
VCENITEVNAHEESVKQIYANLRTPGAVRVFGNETEGLAGRYHGPDCEEHKCDGEECR